jgi:hypothetical protein
MTLVSHHESIKSVLTRSFYAFSRVNKINHARNMVSLALPLIFERFIRNYSQKKPRQKGHNLIVMA